MVEADFSAALDQVDRLREADEPHSLIVRFGPDKPLPLDAGIDLSPFQIAYQTYGEYKAVARAQADRHEGSIVPIRMPMMFCLAFRRDVYERLGPIDERYEVGMFEDEDFALRAKDAGFHVAWAPEVEDEMVSGVIRMVKAAIAE